jgi:hypothetical protein
MVIFTPNTVIKSTEINANFAEFTSKNFVEPDTNWTNPTFSNSWANYDSSETTFYKAGYYKDAMGWVHLRGIVKDGTVGTGVAMFTLPSGYRPSKAVRFAVCSGNAYGSYFVNAAGECGLETGSNAFVFLENVTFKV